MVTNQKPESHSAAQIGCCSDVSARLALYNSDSPVPGSDRRTRQAAGHWNALVVVKVPPERGLSARALSEQWKVKSRKIHCRFSYGALLAESLQLPWYVNVDELKKDDRICEKEKKLVQKVCAKVDRANGSGEARESVAGCREVEAAQGADGGGGTSVSSFDGVSFAKKDKPRARYRKKRRGKKGGAGKVDARHGGVTKAKPLFVRSAKTGHLAEVLASSLR